VVEDATADVTSPPPGPHVRRRQDDLPSNTTWVPAPAANPSGVHGTNDVAAGPLSTPLPDEAANPFLASGPQQDTALQNPSLPTSTEWRFHMVTPSTLSQSSGHPRAGRHSTIHHPRRRPLASGPAGHKHRHAAGDVWTFFTEIENKNNCVFCK
jgi:hypothetical protein